MMTRSSRSINRQGGHEVTGKGRSTRRKCRGATSAAAATDHAVAQCLECRSHQRTISAEAGQTRYLWGCVQRNEWKLLTVPEGDHCATPIQDLIDQLWPMGMNPPSVTQEAHRTGQYPPLEARPVTIQLVLTVNHDILLPDVHLRSQLLLS